MHGTGSNNTPLTQSFCNTSIHVENVESELPFFDDHLFDAVMTDENSKSSSPLSDSSSEELQPMHLHSMQKFTILRENTLVKEPKRNPFSQEIYFGEGFDRACSHTEDTLLMHYLDHVFYFQYPFYQPCEGEGRGWLLSMLRRVKSAYHATLALSECHKHSTYPSNTVVSASLDHFRAKGGHYDSAIRKMQDQIGGLKPWSGNSGLVHSVEALTCILQLLFWEVCSTTIYAIQVRKLKFLI
jgi:hypothetical protein